MFGETWWGNGGYGGSDLDFFLMRVEELNVSEDVGYVEIWVGSACDRCKLEFVAMAELFWHCGRWVTSWVAVGVPLLVCFVLAALCWFAV